MLFILPARTVVAEKPTIVGGELIVNVDGTNDTGSTWIHMRNDTAGSMKVFLHVGDLISRTTQRKVPVNVVFQQSDSARTVPFFEGELAPNHSLHVRLEISGFTEAGEAGADLFDRGTKVTAIKAVKFNVPFGVSLDAADPSHPALVLQRGKPNFLVFKNEDPMSYPVEWSLLLSDSGTVVGKSTIVIPARSSVPVDFRPNDDAFKSWLCGLFKSRDENARLVLRFAPPGDVTHPDTVTKVIPVKAQIYDWYAEGQWIVSNVAILLLLILGGLFSLFLSLWIPNKLQCIELLRRLKNLSDNTKKISAKIDSSLRVGVRVERLRLEELIRSVWAFSAEASTTLSGYKGDITLLDRRIKLIQELDTVTGVADSLASRTAGAPARILDEVWDQVKEATELLNLPSPQEAHFQNAEQLIREVALRLRGVMNEDLKLAEQLASWVVALRESYDKKSGEIGKLQTCKELRPQLGDLFSLFETRDYEDKLKILPVHYHWLSSTIERLFVLRHYIRAYENTADGKRDKIEKQKEEFLKYLKIRTWNALRDARRLRFEIEEGIFSDEVEKALAEGAVSISRVPIQPFPNQLVRLEVQFNNKDLNTCTARQEFRCVWDFGNVGIEEGWAISHYFRNPKEIQYSVSFRGHDGKIVERAGGGEVKVSPMPPLQLQSPPKRLKSGRVRIEAIRLAVALGVAVLGLMAGAREQLLKLDVISGLTAVFLLGFGADTVKNIITRRTPGET
jgi:hypothetical protein